MANILLVTGSTTHAAYTGTKSALEGQGHTVTGSADDTTSLAAAWSAGSFDLIATVYMTNGSPATAGQTWVADRWGEGVPVLVGGFDKGREYTAGAYPHLSKYLGLIADTLQQYNANDGPYLVDVATHPITTGYTVGSTVTVRTTKEAVRGNTSGAGSAAGTLLAELSTVSPYPYFTAVEVGDTLLSGSLAPATAPARAVFAGWVYSGYNADGNTLLGQAVDWLAPTPAPGAPTGNLVATLPALTADLSGTYAAPPPPTYTGDLAASLPSLAADLTGTYAPPAGAAPLGALDVTLPGLTATLSGAYTAPATVVPTGTLAATLPTLTAALTGAYVGPTLEEATTDRVNRSNGRTRVMEWTVEVELPLVDDDGYLIREDGTPILDGNGDPVPAPPGYGGTPTRTRGHDYAIAATTPPPTLVDGRPT